MTKQSESIITIAFGVLTLLLAGRLYAEDTVHAHLRQVVDANSLVGPGKTPFHLQMSFQYYNTQGKPSDAGVLEEWWVASGTYLITVATPSLNQGKPTPLDGALKIDLREEYSLRTLLNSETDPLSVHYLNAVASIKESNKKVGKNDLRCFSIERNSMEVCIDPQSDGIRVQTMGNTVVAMRNSLQLFEKTNIAAYMAIAYGGVPAIVGHLGNVETFDPAQSDIKIPQNPPGYLNPAIGEGVVPGKLVKRVDLEFPSFAPLGTWRVLVSCTIMRDGTTSRVFALNSPNPRFTQSSIDAVKKYRFEPFLFQGKPVEAEIQVEVNFQRY